MIYAGLILFNIIALTGFFVLRNLHNEKPVDENRTVYVETNRIRISAYQKR
jgi:hypothetical protein